MKTFLWIFIGVIIVSSCKKQESILPESENTETQISAAAPPPGCTGNNWTSINSWPFYIPPSNAAFNYVVFTGNNKMYIPSHSYSSTKRVFVYDGSNWTSVVSAVPWQFSNKYFTAFSVGDKGYAFQDDVFLKLFEYNMTTNVWTDKGFFGGGDHRLDPVSFVIGNKAYVAGGCYFGGLNYTDLWEYNPANNQWTQKASMPAIETGHAGGAGFSINGKGYIVGGYKLIHNDNATYTYNYTNSVLEYDPVADSWTYKAIFPGPQILTGLNGASAFAIGFSGYVGMNGHDFYKYSPVTNTWQEVADFPGQPYLTDWAVSLNSKGYVFSNATGNSGMYRYNPKICTGTTP